jgi:hypothetical protein
MKITVGACADAAPTTNTNKANNVRFTTAKIAMVVFWGASRGGFCLFALDTATTK